MKKIPVILDCDPGHDDAMALIMAHGASNIDLKLVTTVAGNNSLEKITKNCVNTMNYIGAVDTPIAKGFPYSMVRDYGRKSSVKLNADEDYTLGGVHGETGLDGFDFPENNPINLEPLSAVEAMVKVIDSLDEKVTIVAVGPLTNVGMLIRTFPRVIEKIEKISIMGGTCDFVLTRPFMEFNTFMDPEATKIVFESGIPIDMHGYDVTYRVMYNSAILEDIKAIGNQSSEMVYDLLKEFRQNHNKVFDAYDFGDYSPIHDACAIAGIIDPSLITESKMMHVDVETSGYYMEGATICDVKDVLGLPHNVNVIFDMDNERFFNLFKKTISNCK